MEISNLPSKIRGFLFGPSNPSLSLTIYSIEHNRGSGTIDITFVTEHGEDARQS